MPSADSASEEGKSGRAVLSGIFWRSGAARCRPHSRRKKHLFSGQLQATFTSSGTPLGECQLSYDSGTVARARLTKNIIGRNNQYSCAWSLKAIALIWFLPASVHADQFLPPTDASRGLEVVLKVGPDFKGASLVARFIAEKRVPSRPSANHR